MKKIFTVLLAVVLILSMAACNTNEKTPSGGDQQANNTNTTKDQDVSSTPTQLTWPTKDTLKVGYSQADLDSTWRTVESDDMEAVAKERGYDLTILNAQGNTEQQLSDVESLLSQGCNVIVITAIDADGIQPALDACKAKGVPVIMKSRGANGVAGEDYVTFCASDFWAEGKRSAEYLQKVLGDQETIKVAEIQGVIGGTDVRDRSGGFHEVADKCGNFEFVIQQPADWSRSKAQEIAANVIQSTGGDIDAFFCHNDEMALGVSLACQAAGLTIGEDIYVVGIDGMIETLDAIKAGTISATVTCTPKFANVVFDCIEAGMKGEKLEPVYYSTDYLVDSTNADEYYSMGF